MKGLSTNRFSKRLSRRIVARMTVLLTITVLFIEFYSHHIVTSISERNAVNMTRNSILEIEKNLKPAEVAAANIAWLAQSCLDSRENLEQLVYYTVANNPEIYGCAIAMVPDYYENVRLFAPYACPDSLGNVTLMYLGTDNTDYSLEGWFQLPYLLKKPIWSEPYYDEGGAKVLMSTFGVPIMDASGEVIGVATADISLDWLSEKLASFKPYPNSQAMLVSRTGSFIAADMIDELAGETIYSLAMRSGSDKLMDICHNIMSGGEGIEYYGHGVKRSFTVFGSLSNGWVVYSSSLLRDVMSEANRMYGVLTIIGFVALLLLFFFCTRVITQQTRPIQDFTVVARKISDGDFNVGLPEIETDDEIKELRDSFEHMQCSLNNYISELKTTTASKERMESELNIGRAIQMSILPKNFPHRENLDLYARVIPAREVGGDLYDFGMKRDDDIMFIIGDVSGKGVPAAMFMAITASAFRFVSSLGLSMEEKMNRINNGISNSNESGLFVTLFGAKVDLNTGEMVYCNCGHNPAVVVEPGKPAYFLPQIPNMAIGVWPGFEYKQQSVILPKGTRLIFYTDGVTEAEAADKSQYGEQRLLDWASGIPADATSDAVNDSLLASVHEFTNGNEQNDDITIMIIRI